MTAKVKQRKAILYMLHNLPGNSRGFSIVELLVGAGIITLGTSALLGFLAFGLATSSFFKQQTEASFLAQEALEAVRGFRNGTGWNDNDPGNKYDGLGQVQTGVAYHVALSQDDPPRWQLLADSETLGMFVRSITFENVQRDVNDNIVAGGGIQDPDTKKVTVTVSWTARTAAHDVTVITYLTNWKQ